MSEGQERKLAAILAVDAVGYSLLMASNEAGTHARLQGLRSNLLEPLIATHHGRIFKLMGDGALVEFPSVVGAVTCAMNFQRAMTKRNREAVEEERIAFRIGINLGDVIVEGDDLYGDGVNVVSRLEKLAAPGGIALSGTVHAQLEGKFNADFDDAGEHHLKNIARPVQVWRWSPIEDTTTRQAADHGPPALSDKPSIAVMPFGNLSNDADQQYLADGITEDVIALLSRVRWLSVSARSSTFAYRSAAVDVPKVSEELGVRYVLEGSLRVAGKRVRVAAQLIDARFRAQVWAERYDREVEDIFALQDEIAQAIVGAVAPEVGDAERKRALRRPPESLDAWSCYQRGLWHIYRFTVDDTEKAMNLFERAIELDAGFAPAYAGKSFCHSLRVFLASSDRTSEELEVAYSAAKRAVALDERDAEAHWVLARAHFWRREHEQAIAESQTAIELNPSFAQAHFFLAWVLTYAGRSEEALPYLDNASRLSPHDPFAMGFRGIRAMALMFLGRLDEALEWALASARHPVAHFQSRAVLVSILGHLNRVDEAKQELDQILRTRPDYSYALIERTFPFKYRRDMEFFVEGLRKAGLPEKSPEAG